MTGVATGCALDMASGLSMFKSADSKLNVELDPEPKLSFSVGESKHEFYRFFASSGLCVYLENLNLDAPG